MNWDHLPISAFRYGEMPRDPECSPRSNLLDLQLITAVKILDRQIAKDHADGYGVDVDDLLERRHALMDRIRTGPHA